MKCSSLTFVVAASLAALLPANAHAAVSYTYTATDFLGRPIGFTYLTPTFITGDTGSINASNFTAVIGGVSSAQFLSSCPDGPRNVCDELQVTAGIATTYSYFIDRAFQAVGNYRDIVGSNATLSVIQVADAPAVPEAASWVMMVTGFGAVGFAMRRRGKLSTTVRFA